jgi:hypothetical protein
MTILVMESAAQRSPFLFCHRDTLKGTGRSEAVSLFPVLRSLRDPLPLEKDIPRQFLLAKGRGSLPFK